MIELSRKVLAQHRITTIADVCNQEPHRIEMVSMAWCTVFRVIRFYALFQILNRKAPFGSDLIATAKAYPRYQLSISEKRIGQDGTIELLIHCGLEDHVPVGATRGQRNPRDRDITNVLTLLSPDLEFIDYRRIP